MAGTDRRSTRDLIEEIGKNGHRFGFFQAVRLLALAARGEGQASPLPSGLRFGTPLSLGFPASEILDVAVREEKGLAVKEELSGEGASAEDEADKADELALQMTVGFMGLTGPSGVLPTAYTELLIERRNFHRDTAAHQFIDLFVHRSVSLFYEAWRKHRFYLAYEAGERDGFTRNVLDLVGVGLKPLQSRLQREEGGLPDIFLTYFAGMLSQKPISASNIAALVRGYFGVDAQIEQFVGQWVEVPLQEQTKLGQQSCVLGESAFAGERIWDRQNKVCVKLGPLKQDEFMNFLPGQPGAIALTELVQFCIGQTLACDLELMLDKASVPPLRLGGGQDAAPRLGHAAWLQTRGLQAHPSDARFSLLA
jgi:type VI secretion system protein ImpH